MLATKMLKIQRLQSLLLLFICTVYSQTEDGCPAADAACHCSDDDSIICVDLGQRTVMPTFKSSYRVFSSLSFQGDTRISEIQSQAFAGLQVRTLDLSDLGLVSVDPAAFSGFNSLLLSKLILANNTLKTLPATVFAGLTSLEVLDLRNNYIAGLRKNTFSDLRSSLTSLFLSNNVITNGGLPDGLLSRFDQLTSLEIEDNLLTRLPATMLVGSTNIAELSLAGNRITTFTGDSFSSLQRLVKLQLDRNDIVALTTGTFRSLTSLRELDLSGNRLLHLYDESLEGLDSLMTLNLSVNQLSNLTVNVLLPLTRLKSLDLSHNLFRRLSNGLFVNKTTLVTVNLSGNNLTISNRTLRGLTSVTELFLSGNSICKISSSLFTDLEKLRMLDLSDNKIAKIEAGLLSFSSALDTINLSGNKLSEIPPDVFRNGPSLTTIDLSRNTIRRINQSTFYNVRLVHIDLSYNEIEFIDSNAFKHIAALSTILLNHNRLVQVPSELFFNLAVIDKVDLDYNFIEILPSRTFAGLYVQDVSLICNKIVSIDQRAFEGSWILKSINLAKNRIEHIPNNTFNHSQLSTVSYLSLSHNKLTEVTSAAFAGLEGLSSLNLCNNRIHTIADGAFSILQRLSDLRLDGNRLESLKYSWMGNIRTLRTLNLSSSGLNNQALPALSGISELTELNLDSNNLTSLALLPMITSLNTLSVRNNSLLHIDYSGSTSISLLDLGRNRLRVDTLAFGLKTFHNLTSLKLDENELGVIPSNAFSPFASRLEELDLSGNGLNSTSLTTFSDLTSIRVLIVDNNQLQDMSYLAKTPMTKILRIFSVKRNRLNSTVFSVLSNFINLGELFLDNNDIESIPDRVFQSIHNIRVLSLGRNILQSISGDAFSGLQQTCRYLDLSRNRLSQIEKHTFSSLKNLKHLDLSENNLTSIDLPPIMLKLQVLQLGGNRLQMFPLGPRRFLRISILNVSRNSMVSRPIPTLTIFGNSKDRVLVVDFQRNNLPNLGDLRLIGSFGNVDFSSNNLTYLSPTVMTRAKYVQQLDMSRNKIDVISPTIWQTVFAVNSLNMSRNSLFLSLPNTSTTENCGTILTTLDLSYNSLREFDAGQIASLSSSLAVLDIRNNSFESLIEGDFTNLTKMTHLFLDENPWNCSCDLVWIRQLLKYVYIDDAKCLDPFNSKGQPVVCYTPPNGCQTYQPTNDSRCQITTTAPRLTTSLHVSSTALRDLSTESSRFSSTNFTSRFNISTSIQPVTSPTSTSTLLSTKNVTFVQIVATSTAINMSSPRASSVIPRINITSVTLPNTSISPTLPVSHSTIQSTEHVSSSIAVNDTLSSKTTAIPRTTTTSVPTSSVSRTSLSLSSFSTAMSTMSSSTVSVSSMSTYAITNVTSPTAEPDIVASHSMPGPPTTASTRGSFTPLTRTGSQAPTISTKTSLTTLLTHSEIASESSTTANVSHASTTFTSPKTADVSARSTHFSPLVTTTAGTQSSISLKYSSTVSLPSVSTSTIGNMTSSVPGVVTRRSTPGPSIFGSTTSTSTQSSISPTYSSKVGAPSVSTSAITNVTSPTAEPDIVASHSMPGPPTTASTRVHLLP